jgi:OOP family OmpA-OmpF porin
MKTHFLKSTTIITGLLLSTRLLAQDTSISELKPFAPMNSFRTWTMGLNAGVLAPAVFLGGHNDYTNWQAGLGYGGYIKYQLLSSLGMRADFLRGKLMGDNSRALGSGASPNRANSSFKTDINWSASLSGELTLINWQGKNSSVQPYISAGAGLMGYKPRITPVGGTEKAYQNGDNIHELVVPVGAGVKFGMSRSVNLDLGYMANFVDGDNLDGYYYGNHSDMFSYGHVGLEFVLGNKSKPQLAGYNPIEAIVYDNMVKDNALRSELSNQLAADLANKLAAERAANAAQLAAMQQSLQRLLADADGDGVSDYFDKCPGTASGVKVDGSGCPLPLPEVVRPQTTQVIITEADRKVVAEAIKNLEFDFGKSTIRSSSFPSLNRVADLLVEKNFSLKLAGHTDNVGSDAANLKLSKDRAESVKAYLVSRGANPSRIEATGYGESQPITTNATAAGRQKNRRVEFTLY